MNAPRHKVAVQEFVHELFRLTPDKRALVATLRAVQVRCDVAEPAMAQFLEDAIYLFEVTHSVPSP